MGFLLDTSVIAELRKRSPDRRVAAWMQAVPESSLFVSVLVLGEVRLGIEALARRDPVQSAAMLSWYGEVRDAFGERIIPVTVEIAETWAHLNVPDRIPATDGILVATAQVHDHTLVTRNVRDLARAGVPMLNPFDG